MTNAMLRASGLMQVMAPTASAAVGVGGSAIRIEVGDRALVGVNPRRRGPLTPTLVGF